MTASKKGIFLLIAVVCAVLLISPIDLIPGGHIDDVLYLIAGIASVALNASKKLNTSEDPQVIDVEGIDRS